MKHFPTAWIVLISWCGLQNHGEDQMQIPPHINVKHRVVWTDVVLRPSEFKQGLCL